jgi:hypothetical protein
MHELFEPYPPPASRSDRENLLAEDSWRHFPLVSFGEFHDRRRDQLPLWKDRRVKTPLQIGILNLATKYVEPTG